MTASGAATTAALAGCGGSDGSSGSNGTPTNSPTPTASYEVDSEAPARVKVLRLTFPQEITYGDSFEGEVLFANVGGEPVEGNAEVKLTRLSSSESDSQTATLNADGLESGESKGHSIGSFDANAAGEYRIEAGSGVYELADDIEPLVSVGSRQAATGEQVESPGGLRYTVSGVQFTESLASPPTENRGAKLRTTLDDQIIAVFSLTVENAQTEGSQVSPQAFSVADGGLVDGYDDPVIEGSPLIGTQVNPGQSKSGWVAYAVPKSGVPELNLGLNLVSTTSSPDVVVDVGQDDPAFPSLGVADVTVPESFNSGTTEFLFEIENTGDAAGTFRGDLDWKYTEDPDALTIRRAGVWYPLSGSFSTVTVAPGETQTMRVTTPYNGNTPVKYRLNPHSLVTFTVTP